MQTKTYIFDIDGTLARGGKPIEPAIYASIEKLRDTHQVIFASARPVRDILPMLPEHFHDALIVGCNGGMVWQEGEFKTLHLFPPEELAVILGYLREHNVPYILDGAWHYAFSAAHHPFQAYVASLSDHEKPEHVLEAEGITKILILDSRVRESLEAYLNERSVTYHVTPHTKDNLFDLTPHRDDKYLTLRAQGVDFGSAAAFGNDANDFAMLRHAAVSVFVGEENVFDGATYYRTMDELPPLIEVLGKTL